MIRALHHPDCALHVNAFAPVESPRRLEAALEGAHRARESGVGLELSECGEAPRQALERVHTGGYLERVEESVEQGGGYMDPDTSTNEHSLRAARLAAGGAICAVESALAGTMAFSLCRPPGHHAGPNYSMGFCLFNNAAVAAAHARDRGIERVAILDWDVHHGNGTQHIFYEDPHVLYLSVHRGAFYPGTGRAEEMGEGEGLGYTVNVPLTAGSGEREYSAAFAGVLAPVLREFRPELVLVSAGYDCHRDDPLGGMALGEGFFGEMASAVGSLCEEVEGCPPAFVLEGGYNLSALAASVAATLGGAETDEQRMSYSPEVESVRRTREVLGERWRSLR